jgi:adenylate cyclase class 2
MRKEIEVKARISDADALIKRLTELSCVFSEPITQEDHVFIHKNDPFPVKLGTNVFRIRKNNGKFIFTFKRPISNGLDKLEHELEISDAEEMEKILELIDFREVSLVKKVRRKTNYKDYEICVDVVDQLGSFVEMEKIAEDVDSSKVQDEMFSLLVTFGIKKEDRIMVGYDVLIHEYEQGQRAISH